MSTWKPIYNRLFQDHEKVLVVGDGDAAGRGFVERVCEELENGVPVVMPPGMDATDVYLAHGADGLRELLK